MIYIEYFDDKIDNLKPAAELGITTMRFARDQSQISNHLGMVVNSHEQLYELLLRFISPLRGEFSRIKNDK